MSLATPPAAGDGLSSAPLRQRLDQVRQELAAQRRRTARATALTAVVGLVALVLLGAYFYYGYTSLAEVTEPGKLVDVAEQMATDNLPQARQSLAEEIKRSAPDLAVGLSKQMLEAMPTARKSLEGHALEQFGAAVDESAVLSDKQFEAFLKDNRPLLQAKYKELTDKPQLADASLGELETALDAQLREDMKAHVGELLATLMASNEKLKRLRDGKGLTADEKIERRTLTLLRRLRAEQLGGPAPVTEKSPPADPKPARAPRKELPARPGPGGKDDPAKKGNAPKKDDTPKKEAAPQVKTPDRK